MKKKTNRKSRSVKSVRDLTAKAVKAKTAAGVKGGESITFVYGKLGVRYTPQNSDGSTK